MFKGHNIEQFNKGLSAPFERGMADSHYGRNPVPHYRKDDLSMVILADMTAEEINAYHAGYEYNEQFGDKKCYN